MHFLFQSREGTLIFHATLLWFAWRYEFVRCGINRTNGMHQEQSPSQSCLFASFAELRRRLMPGWLKLFAGENQIVCYYKQWQPRCVEGCLFDTPRHPPGPAPAKDIPRPELKSATGSSRNADVGVNRGTNIQLPPAFAQPPSPPILLKILD